MVNWEANVFPGILGRTCDRPCEPACRRGRVEKEPVAICRLKRAAADYKGDISALLPGPATRQNGKRIALVGAGHRSSVGVGQTNGLYAEGGTDKRKQSLYFPEDMLNEIQIEANRQDRSLSWIVQQAWKHGRDKIKSLPSVNDSLSGDSRPDEREERERGV